MQRNFFLNKFQFEKSEKLYKTQTKSSPDIWYAVGHNLAMILDADWDFNFEHWTEKKNFGKEIEGKVEWRNQKKLLWFVNDKFLDGDAGRF